MPGRDGRALIGILTAVLCAGAALLIALVLAGSGVDETSGKVVAVVVLLAFFSLTGVAGINLAQRDPQRGPFGLLTAGLAVAAFSVATITIVWEVPFGDDGRIAWGLAVLAFASGHTSVLLSGIRASERSEVTLVRRATVAALVVLVAFALIDLVADDDLIEAQPFGVAAILYGLGTILLLLLRSGSSGARPSAEPASGVGGLDHVVIAVSDWDRANAFYRDALGAEILELPGRRTAYQIGAQRLNVHGPGTDASPLAASPVGPGNSDLCFRWEGDADSAATHLRGLGIEIVGGPLARTGAAGAGTSVYCRDPDGSLIELISYAA